MAKQARKPLRRLRLASSLVEMPDSRLGGRLSTSSRDYVFKLMFDRGIRTQRELSAAMGIDESYL